MATALPSITIYVCSDCGDTITRELPATGHHIVLSEEKSSSPTCTTDGENYYEWVHDGCDYGYGVKVPATGHEFALDEDKCISPTCTTDGVTFYSCEKDGCSAGYGVPVPATGHSYTLQVEKTATTTREGQYCHECANDCGSVTKMQTAFPIRKIVLSKKKYACTGSPVVPSFRVYDTAGRVIPARYYTAVCYNNRNVGTATLHLTFSELYSGTLKKEFRIVRGKQRISVNPLPLPLKEPM